MLGATPATSRCSSWPKPCFAAIRRSFRFFIAKAATGQALAVIILDKILRLQGQVWPACEASTTERNHTSPPRRRLANQCRTSSFPWDRITKRAGLTDLRLHDVRHSFARFLADNGKRSCEVQKLPGHPNLRSSQRSPRLSPDRLGHAAEVMASILKNLDRS